VTSVIARKYFGESGRDSLSLVKAFLFSLEGGGIFLFNTVWDETRQRSAIVWSGGLEECVTHSVHGIDGRVADVLEGIGAEAFG